MGFWPAKNKKTERPRKGTPRPGARKKGRRLSDSLSPALFVRPLEDRYVLSVSPLAPQAELAALIAASHAPAHASPTAAAPAAAAPISVDVIHDGGGLSVMVNGQALPSDSASQLAVLTMSNGHATINVGGLVSSSPVNLTITGEAGDTINLNGTLELGGGNLTVTGQMIHAAGTIVSAGGNVVLDAGPQGTLLVSGRIDVSNPAPGKIGGSVELLGTRVGLLGGATIDASGDAGGGMVLVGGDSHGANPNILDAQQTYVDAGVQINADAMRTGSGGKVVVWANDSTTFAGTISARGGALGGNGGTAEVSGEVALTITGHADLSAANGHDGTLLLDPGSVTIEHEAAGNTGPDATQNVFFDDWISGQLAFGSLDISTANSTDGLAETLLVSGTTDTGGAAVISWSTANTLSLDGGSSITLDAGSNISNTATGNLTLNGGSIALGGTISLTGGTLGLDTADPMTQTTGFSAANLSIAGGGTFELSQANTISSSTTIGAGLVLLGNAGALGAGSIVMTGGTLDLNGQATNDVGSLSGTGTITNGSVSTNATLRIVQTTNGVFSGTIDDGPSNSLALVLDTGSTATLTLSGNNAYSGGTTINAGTLQLGSATALGLATDIVTVASGGVLDLNGQVVANLNSLTLNGSGISSGGALTNSSSTAASYAGAITLNADSSIGGSGNITLGGAVSGAVNLTKVGSDALALNAANSFGNGKTFTISAGTVQLGNAAAFGNANDAVSVSSGAVLDLDGQIVSNVYALTLNGVGGGSGVLTNSSATNASFAGAVTLNSDSTIGGGAGNITLGGTVSGAANLTKAGTNTLLLNAGNSLFGQSITFDAGTVKLGNAGALGGANLVMAGGTLDVNGLTTGDAGSLSGTGTITNSSAAANATLKVVQTTSGTFSGTIQQGTRTLALVLDTGSTATLTLSGNNSYSGGTTVDAGTLQLGSGSALGAAASTVAVASGAALDLNGQTVTNVYALTLNGSGISSGGALTNSSSAATSFAGTVALAAAASIGGSGNITLGGIVSGNQNLTKVGSDTLVLNGTNTFGGTAKIISISAGTLQLGSAAALGSANNAVLVSSGAALDLNGQTVVNTNALTINGNGVSSGGALTNSSGTAASFAGTIAQGSDSSLGGVGAITLGGVVSGPFNLTKIGTDTLILSAANTFGSSKTFTISAGTVQLGNAAALGNASDVVSVSSGAILDLNGQTVTNTYALALNGSGNGSDVGALTNSATHLATFDGAITLGSDTSIGGDNNTILVNGAITGAHDLTKTGSDTLALGNTNDNFATVTVTAGTVQLRAAGALAGTAIAMNGGTLDVDGQTMTDAGSLSGAGIITNGSATTGTLKVVQTASGTFSGTIEDGTGDVALVLDTGSTATLDLSGNNGYSGGTAIDAGTLQLGSATALGTAGSSVTVASGGMLDLNGQSVTNAYPLSLSGTGVSSNGALTNLSGTAASYAGTVAMTGNATIGGSGNITLGAAVSGAFSLTKVGGATLLLNAADTFGGTGKSVTVSGGTLQLGNTAALGNANNSVSVASGASLDLNGLAIATQYGLTLNGSGISSNGALTNSNSTAATYAGQITLAADSSIGGSGNITLSNVVSGSHSLAKIGNDTLLLSNANTFGGNTDTVTVSAGTLQLGNAGALGNAANAVTVASGATLDLNGTTVTATNPLTLSGTGVSTNGALTNSSATAASYAGAITLAADASLGGTGNLTLNGTVDGDFNLSTVGAGGVTFAQTVGGTTPLAGLTADATGTTTLDAAIYAAAQDYLGAVVLGGSVTLAASSSTAATSVSFASTLDGTHSLTINSAATTFGGLVGDANALSILTVSDGLGTIAINGGAVYAGSQQYSGAVTLGADTIIAQSSSGSTSANLRFLSTVDGDHNLTINAGSGGFIELGATVGGLTPLGTLTITNVQTLVAADLNVASLTESAGTTSSDFQGTIVTSAGGVSVTGAAVTFEQLVTTTGGGATIANSGLLTVASMTLDGAFLQQGAGSVSAAGTIATDGHAITFTDSLALTGSLTLDATDGGTAAAGGNIQLPAAVSASAAADLTLAAGTGGTITASASIGSSVRNLTVTSADGVTLAAATLTGNLSITSSATVQLNGNVSAGGTQSYAADVVTAANIELTGTTVTFDGRLSPGGDNAATTLTIDGNLELGSASTLYVNLDGTTAGSGYDQIVVTGAASTLTIASGASLAGEASHSFSAANGGDTLTIISGPASLTGNFTQTSPITFTGQNFNIDYGPASSGSVALVRAPTTWTWDGGGSDNNWTTAANWVGGLGTPGQGDIVQFDGTTQTDPNNNNAAGFEVDQIVFLSTAGAFTLGGHQISLEAGIANDSAQTETVNMPIVLAGDQTFSATGGPLAFGSTATIDGGHALTLGGSSTFSFAGTIGGMTPLASLAASGISGLTLAAASVTGNFGVSTTGSVQLNGDVSAGGTQTYTGSVTTAADLKLTGSTVTFNGRLSPGGDNAATTLTIDGNLVLGASSTLYVNLDGTTAGSGYDQIVVTGGSSTLAIDAGAALGGEASHSFSAAGGGDTLTVISGPASVTGQFTPANSITLTGQDFAIDYGPNGGGSVALVRQPTTWTWSGGDATSSDWTLADNWTAGSGAPGDGDNVVFTDSSRLTPFNDNTGLTIGSITFDGSDAFTLGGNALTISGGIVNNSSQTEIVNLPITLGGDQTFEAVNGFLTFGSSATIDGNHALTLTVAVNGGFTFNAAVGGATPLSALNVDAGLVANAAVTAAALTTINQPYAITFNSNVSITGASATAFSNTGGLTLGNSTADVFLFAGGLNTKSNAVSLEGTVRSTGQSIIIDNATLAGTTTIDSTNSNASDTGGAINLTVDTPGGNDLTLNAGSEGTIGLSAPDGGEFGAVQITKAGGATFSTAIDAASFTQSAGNGTTLFQSDLQTGSGGIAITAANVTFDGTVSADGAISITNSGQLTLGPSMLGSGFTQTSGGASSSVSAQGTLYTTSGAITINSAVTLAAAFTADSTDATSDAGGADIHFASTIDGGKALTLDSGSVGTIALDGDIGGQTPVGAITIENAAGVTASGSISAASLTQQAGTGTSDFQGAITTSAAAGVNITGNNVTFAALITTTGGGGVTVTNAGTLTFASMSLAGPFLQNGAGASQGQGDIATAGQTITFGTALTLSSNLTLDATAAGSSTAGASVLLSSTIDGAHDLTLDGGTAGNVTLTGAAGSMTALGAISITDADNVTAAAITAASLAQLAGGGTSDFQGAITTSGTVGVSITGDNVTFQQLVTATGGGGISVTNSGLWTAGSLTSSGAILQQGSGTVSAQGTWQTSGQSITVTGAASLAGALVVDATEGDTVAAGGNIRFHSTIDGGQSLTLDAGSGGALELDGNLGGSTPLGSLTIVDAGTTTLASVSTAGAILQEAGGTVSVAGNLLTAGGTITFRSAVALTGTTSFATDNSAAAGADIHFFAAITGSGQNLSLQAGSGGTATFDGSLGTSVAPLGTLTLDTAAAYVFNAAVYAAGISAASSSAAISLLGGGSIGGAADFQNTGGLTLGNTSASVLLFTGGINAGTNAVSLAGTLRTTATAIDLSNLTLTTDATLDATNQSPTSAGATITLGGILGNNHNLTIDAGTAGTIGLTTAASSQLGDVTLVDSAGGTIGTLTAASFTQQAGTGTLEFQGVLTTTAGSVAITGQNVTFDDSVSTTGGGMTVTNTGLLTMNSMSLGGAFLQQGGGSVSAQGTLATTGRTITINGALTLAGGLSLDTTNSGGSSSGNNIHLVSAVSGGQNLSLDAGSAGTISLDAALGSSGAPLGSVTIVDSAGVTAAAITASALTQQAGTGTSDFQGAIQTTGSNGVNITAAAVTFEQMVTTTGGGGVTVNNSGLFTFGSMTLSGPLMQTGTGGVSAQGTVATSGASISLAGSVTLAGNLLLDTTDAGANTGGANISLQSATDGDANLTFNAGTAGTVNWAGTSATLGDVLIVDSAGVTAGNISAATLAQQAGTGTADFQGTVTTSGADGVNVTGSSVTFEKLVTTTGSGGVTVNNSGLLTMGPMTLSGNFLQKGGGSVAAHGTLATHGGSVTFTNAVTLTGTAEVDTTDAGATAAGGTIQFDSTLDGGQAFTLDGGSAGAINLDAAVGSAAPLGSLTVTGGGPLTMGSVTLTGAFLQQGGGKVSAQGTLATAGGSITLSGALTLTGALTLNATNAGASGGAISLGGTVDGGFALAVDAGTMSASFLGAIGGVHALTQFTVARADGGIDFGSDLHPLTSLTTSGPVSLGSQAAITGGIRFFAGNDPTDMFTLATTGSGGTGSSVTINGPVTLASNLTIDAGQSSSSSVLFTSATTINSQAGAPPTGLRSLTVLSGSGGIEFQAKAGFTAPLSNLTVHTTGVLTIDSGVALQTLSADGFPAAVSTIPLPLVVNPPDPNNPIIASNTTQTISGEFGSVSSSQPELGENFHITVDWADKSVSTLPANVIVNAGDTVTLTSGASGDTWTVTPGSGSGPVHFVLQHTYLIADLINIGTHVSSSLSVSYDPTIVLTDGRLAAAGGPLSLTSATGSLQTPVATSQFSAVQPPASTVATIAAPSLPPPAAQPAAPTNTLTESKTEDNPPPQTKQSDEGARQLILVRVGADGSEGDPHVLPDDALERLGDLFEKFKRMHLPNGRYRIYLVEPGFSKRLLREFYKSGDTIGDPIREPGPGSHKLGNNASGVDNRTPGALATLAQLKSSRSAAALAAVHRLHDAHTNSPAVANVPANFALLARLRRGAGAPTRGPLVAERK